VWVLNHFGVSTSEVSSLADGNVSICEQESPQIYLIQTATQKPVNKSPGLDPQTIKLEFRCTNFRFPRYFKNYM
jgi:hypothetical protein